jgi:hypothetical protein
LFLGLFYVLQMAQLVQTEKLARDYHF